MKPCMQRTYIEDVLEDIISTRIVSEKIERSREKGHGDRVKDMAHAANKEIAEAAIANSQNVNELEIPDFLKRG